jgi:hypothetical protein
LRASREIELRVLTLPAAREVLAQEGIELISYRDFDHKNSLQALGPDPFSR